MYVRKQLSARQAVLRLYGIVERIQAYYRQCVDSRKNRALQRHGGAGVPDDRTLRVPGAGPMARPTVHAVLVAGGQTGACDQLLKPNKFRGVSQSIFSPVSWETSVLINSRSGP